MKVSVIIPTFERTDSLKKAVESVLNQTFKDFEIIVVNDSVNEKDTIALLNKFEDNRIRYYPNERGKGANGARNTGIIKSQGKYIAFLDDDDEWFENKLMEQYQFISNSSDIIGGVWSGILFFEGNEFKVYNTPTILNQNLSKEIILGKISLMAGSNIMIKKNIIDDIGLYDEELIRYQDLEFVIRILRNYELNFLNKVHIKIYPSGLKNPFTLEKAYKQFVKKIIPELNKFNGKELKLFYTHNYYTLAKSFSENRNFIKTFIYILKIHKYKVINPFTSLYFIINSLLHKNK